MKKIINKQLPIKFNFLSKKIIYIFLINFVSFNLDFFCVNAEASNLKITPSQAFNALENIGLNASISNPKKLAINGQWDCSNNSANSSKDSAINFSYQASGDNSQVNNPEIKAKILDPNYTRLMQKKLIEISEILSQKALGISLTQEAKDAIINSKSLTLNIEKTIVKITQEKLSSNMGNVVSLKIYSEN
jgi:hypothetical protein